MRAYGSGFCSVPLSESFVYLCVRISSNASSIAGVQFDSVGSLRATLWLRNICMLSCCIAAWKHYKPNPKYQTRLISKKKILQ